MKDLKYISAYSIPLVAFIGIWQQGFLSFLTPIYVFGLIPIVELFTPASTENLSEEDHLTKNKKRIFDLLLYLNVPIVYGCILFTMYVVTNQALSTSEYVGTILSLGIVLGSNGINVGHELGHRFTNERFLAKALLLPSHYMHFYIEHNFGHHQKAATKEDPATARYNQPLYFFWFSSVIGQYFSAWSIQRNLLKKENASFLSLKNDMFWYILFSVCYLSFISVVFGTVGVIIAFLSGVVGFLLLETINYVEHYGLRRQKLASGRYERVREIHSWNSNHTLGRILLFELTRHSDHHYRASKKYQILDHHDKSPQLPFGYPTSIVLSLFPPVWFKLMNKRVPEEMRLD